MKTGTLKRLEVEKNIKKISKIENSETKTTYSGNIKELNKNFI